MQNWRKRCKRKEIKKERQRERKKERKKKRKEGRKEVKRKKKERKKGTKRRRKILDLLFHTSYNKEIDRSAVSRIPPCSDSRSLSLLCGKLLR